MRAVLIINPVSGDDDENSQKVATIQAWLTSAPFDAEVCFTSEERGARAIAREAVAAGVEAILVGGGDGTVSEVARELVRRDVTLGILPIGTFNNIARSIGVLAELPVASAIIDAGHVQEIDVGLANGTDYFFEAAGVGLDAALFPLGEEIKSGRWTRIVRAVRLAFQYEPQTFTITLDGSAGDVLIPAGDLLTRAAPLTARAIRREALMVVAANGPYYGGGFTVVAGARLRDGRLTTSIYRRFSKWELLRHFLSISKGRRHYSPKIETFTAREVEITSPSPAPVHIDGQPFGVTPVSLRTLPGALRVFAPRHSAAPDTADCNMQSNG